MHGYLTKAGQFAHQHESLPGQPQRRNRENTPSGLRQPPPLIAATSVRHGIEHDDGPQKQQTQAQAGKSAQPSDTRAAARPAIPTNTIDAMTALPRPASAIDHTPIPDTGRCRQTCKQATLPRDNRELQGRRTSRPGQSLTPPSRDPDSLPANHNGADTLQKQKEKPLNIKGFSLNWRSERDSNPR